MTKPAPVFSSPFLLVVFGLPGTGKTTFARTLAAAIGCRHYNTDIIRDEKALRGQYDEKTKARVYTILRERVAESLHKGQPAVVDGTFYKASLRQPFDQLARSCGVPIHWIEVQAPEAAVRERVAQKRTFSEADFAVYRKVKAAWQPPAGAALILQSGNLEEMADKAIAYLREKMPAHD